MSKMAMEAWAKGPEQKPALSEQLRKHGWKWEMNPDGTGNLRSKSEPVARYDMVVREYRIYPGFSNNNKWQYFECSLNDLMRRVEETVESYGHGVRKETV